MTATALNVIPRNKDGKTNAGIPYRYSKAIKSKALKSKSIDLTVLNKNELKLMELLKQYKTCSIPDLQDEIFPTRSYTNYGTSDTRNLLRRVGSSPTGCKLIERVPGNRGSYRLTAKGRKHLDAFKKSGGKLIVVKPKSKSKDEKAKKSKAKSPAKVKAPAKSKAPAKKTKDKAHAKVKAPAKAKKVKAPTPKKKKSTKNPVAK